MKHQIKPKAVGDFHYHIKYGWVFGYASLTDIILDNDIYQHILNYKDEHEIITLGKIVNKYLTP